MSLVFLVWLCFMAYLMPDPVYTFILYDLQANSLLVTFLNEPELIRLRTIKCIQVIYCLPTFT